MSEPNPNAAAECPCDADILADVSTLLQDSACLHYALKELIADAQNKEALAQSSALRRALGAQLRVYSANLGAWSGGREADCLAIAHRHQALKSLAHADYESALHNIGLCDADALRRIAQHCSVAGLSDETRNMLRIVHRILLQSSLHRCIVQGPQQSQP